jgi:hypothetical protein
MRPWSEARVVDWIRLHIERELGLAPITLDEIDRNLRARRVPEFQAERDTRTRMGYIRYEQLGPKKGGTHNTPEAMRKLIDLYTSTKNREFLIDLANYCELEWQFPAFEGTHFTPTDR